MIMKSSLDCCPFPIARMVYAATRLGKAALNLRTGIFPDTNATDHPDAPTALTNSHQTTGDHMLADFEDRGYRVAKGPLDELLAPVCEQWLGADHEPADSQLDHCHKNRIEVAFAARIQDIEQ